MGWGIGWEWLCTIGEVAGKKSCLLWDGLWDMQLDDDEFE